MVTWFFCALAGALFLSVGGAAGAQPSAPPLTLNFRMSRVDLDCLVQASNSLMDAGNPIIFSPDMCVGESEIDQLLSATKRTSLPNRKASLPNRQPGRAGPPPLRLVFSRKTLSCLVKRSRDKALPSGDPVQIDLRACA